MSRRLQIIDYKIGWVCALPIELAAATQILDEEHQGLPRDPNDDNLYTFGSVHDLNGGQHNVVIACLPDGRMGTESAASVAAQMKMKYASIQFGLMVGIGGGVPSQEVDIRLGDLVVSKPNNDHGGVIQHDSGKVGPNGHFIRTRHLNTPPTVLLNALAKLRSNHLRGKRKISEHLSAFSSMPDFSSDQARPDILFEASYPHVDGKSCAECDRGREVKRSPRNSTDVVVHYGTIASGNVVMKDGITRDKLSAQLGGVLCFEMEAAGLLNTFPCLVIRGICDYADSHKNDQWQSYAAATAAAYAKELLHIIPAEDVAVTPAISSATRANGPNDFANGKGWFHGMSMVL
jgi:nucleoside phosphorylase